MSDKAIEAAARAVDAVSETRFYGGEAQHIAQAAIRAYNAAMEAEGFVLVPVEPTPAMCQRGGIYTGCVSPREAGEAAMQIYAAMFAARPRAEGE